MPRKIINLQELRSLQDALDKGDARAIVSLLFHNVRDEIENDVLSFGVPSEKLNLVIASAPKSSLAVLTKVVETAVARINELEARAQAMDDKFMGPNARATTFRFVAYQLRSFCRNLGMAFDKSRSNTSNETAAA